MITVTENFEYNKDILLIFLRNGFSFLYEGYEIVLKKKTYSLRKDSRNLENNIRDDIYREAVKLLKDAGLKDRGNRYLRFSFYNENRDPTEENNIKRFDICLNYDPASYESDIIIECKRLRRNNKNKAYINNGIERFETNRYGYGLPIGAMIGFIEDGKEKDIIDDLIKRIDGRELIINGLSNCREHGFSKKIEEHIFYSIHTRPNPLQPIELYHFFLDFTSIISE